MVEERSQMGSVGSTGLRTVGSDHTEKDFETQAPKITHIGSWGNNQSRTWETSLTDIEDGDSGDGANIND